MYVKWWTCIRGGEESLSCAAHTTFWSQITADILSYPQRQRAAQKRNSAYFHLLQEKGMQDPPLGTPKLNIK